MTPCRCGHWSIDHLNGGTGRCNLPAWMDVTCSCAAFDLLTDLPKPGERLEFGKHRIPAKDAETAPAWPSLARFASSMRRRSLGR